ncbi:prolyl oligopeptidase family serine peptidase [uncultured Paludibaculum sp.]|uniref:S9 family peptidase n=1 Tax=uncultured Paludibaculum sp. TaxID=1765020 RepID=UPI002AAB82D9|nr:prolyl oligopeptidase family serine peptidase [uncultured Paludibaculum sp.]
MKPLVSAVLCALLTVPAPAQSAAPLPLTVDSIMRGPGIYGYEPRAVRWSGDGRRVYFEWKVCTDPLDKDFDTYVVQRDGSGLTRLSEDDAKLAPPAAGSESKDHRLIAYSEQGDLFVYDRSTGKRRQLTKTSDVESNPQMTRDGRKVAFVRGGNLYTITLSDGLLEQLTDIRPAGAAPSAPAAGPSRGARTAASGDEPKKGTDSQETLKKEERELLEVIQHRAKKREETEARRKKENPRKPMNLGPRETASNMLLAPDESYVLVTVLERAADSKTTVVPNFVTEAGYTEDISSRTNVGDTPNKSRMAIVKVATGEVTWLDHGQKLPANPEAKPPVKESERPVTLLGPQWSEDGAKLAVAGRAGDNKDRWIFAVDTATGKLRPIFHLHDDAWVDGPGSFRMGRLPGSQTLYFQAEITGWSHLYTVNWEGGEPKALTTGKWEVESVVLSRDETRFGLVTSEESPHVRNFYWMPTSGGPKTRITSQPGDYEVTVSPDEQMLAVVHSYTNKPPELYLMENKPGAPMTRVTTSPAPEFSAFPWLDVPIVQVPARDGTPVPARLYQPKNWKKGGPAVIFVHGAGYLQNVHRWWSNYSREYMFHHLLMQRGYLVIDVDYRGSAGYGRDWRTAIYRHMGGQDLDDQVDAAHFIVKEYGVDPKRIGLYGGSYGGFITLMALFTQPDVFAAGAALRPVTDWAHYNHGYTSNILNLPQKDLEAYKRSSPIYHAAGLKGALLICHGMVDTNVHFQDTVLLVQKLIELRKENWSVAPYPVEDHGFVQPSSWADEYKRILNLFETSLKK